MGMGHGPAGLAASAASILRPSPRRVEGGIRGKQMFPPEDRVGGNAAGTDLPQKVARSERMSGDFLCLVKVYLPLRARATLLLSSIESCRRR